VKKIIITTGAGSGESDWEELLSLTSPRMEAYADRHGYDFKEFWYTDLNDEWQNVFRNPDRFVSGAVNYEVRKDFIRWRGDRALLAPSWLRYAAVIQLMDTYDVVVYLDGDVVVCDFSEDFLSTIPEDKWLGSPISGPSADNAGPGGPMIITRSQAKEFWRRVWDGRLWISNPLWTDGVDMMAELGYTTTAPVHKIIATAYDLLFYEVPRGWLAWHPERGRMVHAAGGSGNVAVKMQIIRQIIREAG
jgi:hypothetical protein